MYKQLIAVTLGAALLAPVTWAARPDTPPGQNRQGTEQGKGAAKDGQGGKGSQLDRYRLANGCYALQSVPANGFVDAAGSGYAAQAAEARDGMAFFMKPSALGKYIFFDRDRNLMQVASQDPTGLDPTGLAATTVVASADRVDAAIWTLEDDGQGNFTIASANGQFLQTAADGALQVGPEQQQFRFDKTRACTEYPEMPLAVIGETYKGQGVDKPVIGFADVHTHMGMSHEMSADDSVGPSAGGVLYGSVFHRLGVEEALDNCEEWHGPNGIRDPNNIIQTNPTGTHDTVGWPSFVDWPANTQLTHQTMYYRWVERAYMAGLRVMVSYGTNIAALCQLGAKYSLHPDADCNDHSVAVKQNDYTYDIQDYVDAQYGGPGKGWFRIVTSPKQAREVINEGKLAVILGMEVAQIFDCGVTFLPDGSEVPKCDEAQIDQKIDELYEQGVRQIVPFHDINSALGGTGLFTGMVMNGLGFLDTGAWWKTYDCPQTDYFYGAGAIMENGMPGLGGDPLSAAVLSAAQGPLPVYPEGRQCNQRGIQDLGRYAIERMMDKKMIMSVDHAELTIKQYMLDVALAQNPPYPMVSGHGGHGGITKDQAAQIIKTGGYIYPYKGNGHSQADFVNKLEQTFADAEANTLFAAGYGLDGNGFGGFAGPRGADPDKQVNYPFTLFQGEGWGPQFANAGIQPLTVDRLAVPQGRVWDIDVDGTTHYGLIADFVEETRIEGGEKAVTALYNSAEAYLQMWEQIEAR